MRLALSILGLFSFAFWAPLSAVESKKEAPKDIPADVLASLAKDGWKDVTGAIAKKDKSLILNTAFLNSDYKIGAVIVTFKALTKNQQLCIFACYDRDRPKPPITTTITDPVTNLPKAIDVPTAGGYGYMIVGNYSYFYTPSLYNKTDYVALNNTPAQFMKKDQQVYQIMLTYDGTVLEYTMDGKRQRIEKSRMTPGHFYIEGSGGVEIVSIQIKGQ